MAAKKAKNMTIDIEPAKVVYTSIQKSSGYNSARLVVKAGDKEYLQISYDWEGSGIPDFAMQLMEFMKSNNVETSGVWPGQEDAHTEFAAKKKMEKCPDCGKPKAFCTCDKEGKEEDDDMKDDKKKKKEKK